MKTNQLDRSNLLKATITSFFNKTSIFFSSRIELLE